MVTAAITAGLGWLWDLRKRIITERRKRKWKGVARRGRGGGGGEREREY